MQNLPYTLSIPLMNTYSLMKALIATICTVFSLNALAAEDCLSLIESGNNNELKQYGELKSTLSKLLFKQSSAILNKAPTVAENNAKLKKLIDEEFSLCNRLGEKIRATEVVCKAENPAMHKSQKVYFAFGKKFTPKFCAKQKEDSSEILM